MKEIFYDKGYRRNRRPVGWINLGPCRQPDFTPRSLSRGQLGSAHLVALLHLRDLRMSHSLCRRRRCSHYQVFRIPIKIRLQKVVNFLIRDQFRKEHYLNTKNILILKV